MINRALAHRFSDTLAADWDDALYTPPGVVSSQEHHQIESLLDNWAETLVVGLFSLLAGQITLIFLTSNPRSFYPIYPAP